jgi:hypothetical protein
MIKIVIEGKKTELQYENVSRDDIRKISKINAFLQSKMPPIQFENKITNKKIKEIRP